jgi:DUF1680 family protein
MERALYNNVLAGMALDGRKFFYVNPLEVQPAVARRRYDCRSVKTSRVGWFGCACCPPNVARLLASAGQYAYGRLADGLAVHLYADGEVSFEADGAALRLEVRTRYPWDGEVSLRLHADAPASFCLRLRIPGWCREGGFAVNGTSFLLGPQAAGTPGLRASGGQPVTGGYLEIRRLWQPGDAVSLSFPMPVERIRADPRVAADAGCAALQRGPLVYCLEEADNGRDLAALSIPGRSPLRTRFDPDLLGGCVVIEGEALRAEPGPALYAPEPPTVKPVPFRAVPYALWANRGEGEMRVWVRES